MNPANARRYGECLLAITRTKEWTWYTVIGQRKVLLNFAIYKDGRRVELYFSKRGQAKWLAQVQKS